MHPSRRHLSSASVLALSANLLQKFPPIPPQHNLHQGEPAFQSASPPSLAYHVAGQGREDAKHAALQAVDKTGWACFGASVACAWPGGRQFGVPLQNCSLPSRHLCCGLCCLIWVLRARSSAGREKGNCSRTDAESELQRKARAAWKRRSWLRSCSKPSTAMAHDLPLSCIGWLLDLWILRLATADVRSEL